MFGSASSAALRLPPPLQSAIEASAVRFFAADGVPAFDFASPPGEPALVPAGSASWRLFRNPIALFVGGIAGVLLELGEPCVRDGVWQHSSFRDDPLGRLRRTGLAAMVTVYGPRSRAAAMIARVSAAHARVTGTTSGGEHYAASDPALLAWVQATAGFGFVAATDAFVRPIGPAERDRLLAEALPAAHLYGAVDAPGDAAALDRLLAARAPRLEPSPIIDSLLATMMRVPAFPAPLRPLQRMLVRAAVDILPRGLRARIGLGRAWRLGSHERLAVIAAAQGAERLILRRSPPVLSCRRMGLADDYLYRRC